MLVCVALCLGMLYQVPTKPSGNLTNQNSVIAEVGDDKVTEQMVNRRIKETFGQSDLPPATMAVYVPMLVRQMIFDRGAAYMAEQMGIKVSDEEVRRQIQSVPQFANLSPEEEKKVVEQMGYTVEELHEAFRKNAVENVLLNQIADSVKVSDEEAENAYRDFNTKIKLTYIVFGHDKKEDAARAAETLATNGGDIETVAKSFRLPVTTSDSFSREGYLDRRVRGDRLSVFTMAVGATIGPIDADDEFLVAKLVEKVDADMKAFAAHRDEVVKKALAKKLEERRKSFEESVLDTLTKQGKIKIHQDVLDRMLAKHR